MSTHVHTRRTDTPGHSQPATLLQLRDTRGHPITSAQLYPGVSHPKPSPGAYQVQAPPPPPSRLTRLCILTHSPTQEQTPLNMLSPTPPHTHGAGPSLKVPPRPGTMRDRSRGHAVCHTLPACHQVHPFPLFLPLELTETCPSVLACPSASVSCAVVLCWDHRLNLLCSGPLAL